ncbi:MAG: sigma-70 family RNA polymerase sigma factor [Fimbriimonadaceae bacterium]|nr:sigma-70 family RNA polymerase sigma factor [Fimbriimonadaceae bacterium]NUM38789.1 sigma-70 family RNA polymerase sigma factor [Armatimonadota bacterium]
MVRGVASLTPQVVLHCTADSGKYIPGLLRDRIARELSRLHYRPIVIFSSTELRSQDWCFPVRVASGFSTLHFSADGEAATKRLADALSDLKLTVENFETLQSHLEVFRRIDLVREALEDDDERDDGLRFAMKFARFGEHVVDRARLAFNRRVWEVPRQIEIARRAKSGCTDSLERFYEMFQYLVFERAREYLKNKHTFISDFEDYVAAGNLGVARGFGRYDPAKPYAPSTLLFFHIDKQISRAFGLLELPMWVPVHVQADMLQACWREKTAFDALAQSRSRVPTDADVLDCLGLDEDDLEVYGRFKLSRLWENRVCWDDLDDDDLEVCLTYREAFDRRDDLRQLEAYLRLDALPKRYRDALYLRVGLDPAARGDQLTLEQVSEEMGVTRERARQLLLKASERALKAEIDPLDPPISEQIAIQKPNLRRSKAKPPAPYPKPTPGIESANQYVDFLLSTMGLDADPNEVHRAMRRFFPFSSLKVERIIRKLEVLAEQASDDLSGRKEQAASEFTTAPFEELDSPDEAPLEVAFDELDDLAESACDRPCQSAGANEESLKDFIDGLVVVLALVADAEQVLGYVQEEFPDTQVTLEYINERLLRTRKLIHERGLEGEFSKLSQPSTSSLIEVSEALKGADTKREEQPSEKEHDCSNVNPTLQLDCGAESSDLPPKPPRGIKKANEYVEHILETYGARYCPQCLHRAMVEHFPQSIITESQIRDKFRRRGWSQ